MNKNTSVVAVVVSFEPNLTALRLLLDATVAQVDWLILVDNGSTNIRSLELEGNSTLGKVKLIKLKNNIGIAAAHNIGIECARIRNAQYVLLMDQDSIPAINMVKELRRALTQLPNAAAAGPVYLSEHQNENSVFIQVKGLRRVREYCDAAHPIIITDALIASGCLIPMSVLDTVGKMREELFIDYVDTEWGIRAQALGYNNYAVWSAKMSHQLGSRAIKFMGRNMIVHSPLRRYYQYRNAILLYKMKHIPINWKIVDAVRLLLRAFFYILTNQPRLQNLKMIGLGLWHGIIGRSGPLK